MLLRLHAARDEATGAVDHGHDQVVARRPGALQHLNQPLRRHDHGDEAGLLVRMARGGGHGDAELARRWIDVEVGHGRTRGRHRPMQRFQGDPAGRQPVSIGHAARDEHFLDQPTADLAFRSRAPGVSDDADGRVMRHGRQDIDEGDAAFQLRFRGAGKRLGRFKKAAGLGILEGTAGEKDREEGCADRRHQGDQHETDQVPGQAAPRRHGHQRPSLLRVVCHARQTNPSVTSTGNILPNW